MSRERLAAAELEVGGGEVERRGRRAGRCRPRTRRGCASTASGRSSRASRPGRRRCSSRRRWRALRSSARSSACQQLLAAPVGDPVKCRPFSSGTGPMLLAERAADLGRLLGLDVSGLRAPVRRVRECSRDGGHDRQPHDEMATHAHTSLPQFGGLLSQRQTRAHLSSPEGTVDASRRGGPRCTERDREGRRDGVAGRAAETVAPASAGSPSARSPRRASVRVREPDRGGRAPAVGQGAAQARAQARRLGRVPGDRHGRPPGRGAGAAPLAGRAAPAARAGSLGTGEGFPDRARRGEGRWRRGRGPARASRPRRGCFRRGEYVEAIRSSRRRWPRGRCRRSRTATFTRRSPGPTLGSAGPSARSSCWRLPRGGSGARA